jgi:hypothetical protein
MKKLLLLISCSAFYFFSCCHHTEKSDAAKLAADSAHVADSMSRAASAGTGTSVGNDKGIVKDTVYHLNDSIAIIHKSQDQAKIDSIKNAKQKNKNPK